MMGYPPPKKPVNSAIIIVVVLAVLLLGGGAFYLLTHNQPNPPTPTQPATQTTPDTPNTPNTPNSPAPPNPPQTADPPSTTDDADSVTYLNYLISGDTGSAFAMLDRDFQNQIGRSDYDSRMAFIQGCHMTWTGVKNVTYTDNTTGKISTGKLDCRSQSFSVELQWQDEGQYYVIGWTFQ